MSRVLFIGNSQLACVKVALDGQPHLLGERQVAYMAFSQLWAGGLEVVDGIVRGPKQIRSDVILNEARLDDYDCVVIVGMGVSTMRAAAIYLTHRLLPHHKQGMHLLSEGAFEAAMTEAVLRSGAGQILAKLRPATEMPILLVPEPLVNAAIRKDDVWSGVWTGEFVPFLVAQYFECVRRYLGSQADLLMQPPETIADEVFTRSSYGDGALMNAVRTRKNGLQFRYSEEDRDYKHMNEQYGELVCRGIGGWLAGRGL